MVQTAKKTTLSSVTSGVAVNAKKKSHIMTHNRTRQIERAVYTMVSNMTIKQVQPTLPRRERRALARHYGKQAYRADHGLPVPADELGMLPYVIQAGKAVMEGEDA